MPFTSLLLTLLTGLVPNGKFKENKVGVTLGPLNPADGENMLLFKADKSAFHKVYLQDQKCCDLVCFAYKLQTDNNEKCKQEITIGLIELKGGGKDQTEEASKQILQTYNGIQDRIRECKKVNISWKALIITKSSMLKSYGENYRKLRENKDITTRHIHQDKGDIDLTKFMNTNK